MLAGSYWEDEVFQMFPIDIQSIMMYYAHIFLDDIHCLEENR